MIPPVPSTLSDSPPSTLPRPTSDEFAALIRDPNTPLTQLDLSEWDLEKKDLSGRNLSGSDLSRAHLNGAKLENAVLLGAVLTGADLRGTRLVGADLRDSVLAECTLAGAELHGARLVGADLRTADLSDVSGLTPDQLRGTLLGAAKLPQDLTFDGLDRVRDLVNRAERQLHVLLLSCISMAVIALATGHSQFFLGNSSLTLPGVDLPVRFSAFFVLAPLVLFGLYTGVSFTLTKLWYEMANLPAQFSNLRGIHDQAAPSSPSFTAAAARYLARRIPEIDPRHGDRWLTIILVWWITPLTILVCVWGAYLPRHDWRGSLWHALVTVATAAWGLRAYHRMDHILSGRFRTPRAGQAPAPGIPPRRGPWLGATGVAALALLLAVESHKAINDPGCTSITYRATEAPNFWCTLFAARLGHAELDQARLIRGNLRRAFMHSARLRHAKLEDATLEYANLIGADLTGADLQDALLGNAALWEAKLDSARMKEAKAPGADFRGASLRSAELQGVNFSGANLQGVEWGDAIVCGATFSPERVDTAGLNDARGWERAFGTGLPSPPPTGDDEPPPAYLRDDELLEYIRWRDAWHAARAGPPEAHGGRVSYAAIYAYLDAIHLSMAESRQREKEVALALLEELHDAGTPTVPYDRLGLLVESLRAEIKRKAANHCVDTRHDPREQRNGGSPGAARRHQGNGPLPALDVTAGSSPPLSP